MSVNLATLVIAEKFVEKWEGFSPSAFQDTNGVWCIGYGFDILEDGASVKEGDTISQTIAQEILVDFLAGILAYVKTLLKVPLTANQYAALVSFTYNVGKTGFKKSSLLASINKKDFTKIPEEFEEWNLVKGFVDEGLTARRRAEANLFLYNS